MSTCVWLAHSSPPKSQATIDGVPCAHNLMKWTLPKNVKRVGNVFQAFVRVPCSRALYIIYKGH